MIRKLFIFILILCSTNIFAQKELAQGFVITETNDTIIGELKDKEYFSASKVKLYFENDKISYLKKELKEININSDKYIKSDYGIWFKAFFKKELTGQINLYSYKRKKYLGVFDTDLNFGRLKPSIKFFCSDYPNISDTIKIIDKINIARIVNNYNDWKVNNPDSKSYFENNIHNKPLINFKVSFLSPGAGFEIGLGEKYSISTILKNEFGYGSSVGWIIINPFIYNQLRYYHNIYKRKAENKRTYKYSGNYLCLVHGLFIEENANLWGFEYGWQRIISKHWYYNIGFGAAIWIGYDGLPILYDLDFGYNF